VLRHRSDRCEWRATRFTYGFVETHADMLDTLAGTQAAPYLRGLRSKPSRTMDELLPAGIELS
jgi:hypothetical protein